MSIAIALIPAAIAAVSAGQALRPCGEETGERILAVGTRMKNRDLLRLALADTGAVVRMTDTELHARWDTSEARFVRDPQGIWTAHMTGVDDWDTISRLLTDVDTAYGLRVQREVVDRLKERAPGAGMNVVSESLEEDMSVTLVLDVGRK